MPLKKNTKAGWWRRARRSQWGKRDIRVTILSIIIIKKEQKLIKLTYLTLINEYFLLIISLKNEILFKGGILTDKCHVMFLLIFKILHISQVILPNKREKC